MPNVNTDPIGWMNETVKTVPSHKLLFRLFNFFLGRKMTYKDLYIYYTNVYDKVEDYKKKAMNTVINIYEYNKE
jgi:hypothetical protein